MLIERVFHWAETTPERLAVKDDTRRWTYADFAGAIATARGYFVERGWAGEGVAALAVANLLDFWVASLALRSLGLTTFALGDVADVGRLDLPTVRGVMTSPVEWWPGLEEACAARDLPLLSATLQARAALPLGAGPTHPPGGHILETSGTTGGYKRVLIDPAFEEDYLLRRLRVSGITQASVVGVLNFRTNTGVGYKSPASTWTVGGSVIMQQRGDWRRTLSEPGLNRLTIVPSLLAEVLAMSPGSFPFNPDLVLSVTGGTITQTQIDQVKARIAPTLMNGLSATESHLIAYTRIDSEDDHRWHRPAIGALVQIVDEADQPTPLGQVGRLRVATDGGPDHYLHDEATTTLFFKDGFFYPGDLAIARADGRFALQGRATDVINVQGHKISPAPIEDRLREALGVLGVCLYSMQDAAGEEQLHVVIEAPAPLPMERLVPALRAELHGFPNARVRYVHALPRNAMGKVMRAAVSNQAA